MNIYIFCNPSSEDTAARLAARFAGLGISCDTAGDRGDYDAVCAVGGDGTILDAAAHAVRRDLPLFGVNTGRVGFLAAFDRDAVDTITLEDIEGLYLSQRSTLFCRLGDIEAVSINEVGIFKEDVGKTIQTEVIAEGFSLGVYSSDGILISTPTGSTAYNLSAGGPVMFPELQCCVVTPICAYNTANRSIVLPLHATVKVRMSDRTENGIVASDGKTIGKLGPGEEIEISRYPRDLKLLLSRSRQTYSLLSGNAGPSLKGR